MINAVIIDEKDNVAIAIEKIEKGEEISYKIFGKVKNFIAIENIEIYHKFAIKEIEKGEEIVKYGEHIGLAGTKINLGEHVHVHNVENHREEL